jgi:uncharacterized protein
VQLAGAQEVGSQMVQYAGECSMNTDDVLTTLRKLKPIIKERYKVREFGLFGSFVRGDQVSDSDIDVLAEF